MQQTDVQKLFEIFSIAYGAARMASHWKGNDPVKSAEYWAKKLANMPRRNIGYAMANLPQDFPPSVDEFLAICRRCPPLAFKSLDYKPSEEEIERNRERIAALAKRFGNKTRHQEPETFPGDIHA